MSTLHPPRMMLLTLPLVDKIFLLAFNIVMIFFECHAKNGQDLLLAFNIVVNF